MIEVVEAAATVGNGRQRQATADGERGRPWQAVVEGGDGRLGRRGRGQWQRTSGSIVLE
jgi:hypothetical protein